MTHCQQRCKKQLGRALRFFYQFITGTLSQGRRFQGSGGGVGLGVGVSRLPGEGAGTSAFWEVAFNTLASAVKPKRGLQQSAPALSPSLGGGGHPALWSKAGKKQNAFAQLLVMVLGTEMGEPE